MKRRAWYVGLLAILAAVTLEAPAFAQSNGWQEIQNGWGEIQTVPGYGVMPAPSGCVSTSVPFFGTDLKLTCDGGLTYDAATDVLTNSTRIASKAITVSGLATPGSITVTPTLSKVGSITTVAGASLVDGDYFTVEYAAGLTVPIEFDATPGDGTTGGRVPYVFAPGDTAGQIRDGLITLLNTAAGTQLTASSGGAATVSLVLDTPGAAGGTNTENVAAAGFAVTGFVNPTAATTYTYRLVARLADGTTTEAGAASTTAAGHATLSVANYNALSWSAVAGAVKYDVYRTVGGATQGKIASATTALTLNDTGLAGGGETAPSTDGTGVVTADRLSGLVTAANGSTVAVGTGTATATVGGVLHVSTTSQATTGTSEQVLATYTLPANTLSRDGQAIRITYHATTANNTNTKTLRVRLTNTGGALISQQVTTTSGAESGYTLTIVRTGAATFNSFGSGIIGTTSGINRTTATAATFSGDVVFAVTGLTPTSAGDLTFQYMLVEAIN